MVGCFELLLLLVLIPELIILLGRYPHLPAKVGRFLAPMAARAARLTIKERLVGSFLVVAPIILVAVAAHPPLHHAGFEVVVVLLFWWAVCFLAFGLVVWLSRRLLRNACPSIGRLNDLLAERLPAAERARLSAHLEHCPACQQRVEELSMGLSWPALARKLSTRPPAPGPALRKVMERLKEGDVEVTREEPTLAADLPLGFLTPTDKPGQLGRLERYEVLEEIGRGGMGVVLKAFDPSLHRVVAIKVLAPQLATSGVARKRFLREAKAAAAVTHDHIVTIHAVDEANGLPYLVMQYIAGQSLQQRIDKDGPLELPDILRIGMQTASALAAAHAHGIVHRDIKPANILLEEGIQRVKITDFGLARAMDDASLTQSGFVAGSPLYMAPEQARGEALDHRADLFSLGSVLYTMCTGRPPFRAINTLAVLRRVSEDTPRPIRETNPEVPDWLADVVAKLMAKEPAERFSSAAEVEEVLGRNLAQLQHAAWVPPPKVPVPSDTAGLPTSLTICPSCGANLQVPERMVGSVVHCFECGKPFHVEEGSEVIQVARPAPTPFGPRCRGRFRRFVRFRFVLAGALLILFLILIIRISAQRAQYRAAAELAAMQARPPLPGPHEPFWKSSLSWLPAEASLFGAFELPASDALTLDDKRTQALLGLLVSEKMARKLTPENLGRIRIQGVSLAYYDDDKPESPRGILHLQGVALDGRKRILDFLWRVPAVVLPGQDVDIGFPTKRLTQVSSPDLPFALGLFDDQHAFLARSFADGARGEQHRHVLEQLRKAGGILDGYNPPWITKALAEIPPHACGFLLGEIPAAWRQRLIKAFRLAVCPRTFVLYVQRNGNGYSLTLNLYLDRAGDEVRLRDALMKGSPQELHHLTDNLIPITRAQQVLAVLEQTLRTARWEANAAGHCVRARMHVRTAR